MHWSATRQTQHNNLEVPDQTLHTMQITSMALCSTRPDKRTNVNSGTVCPNPHQGTRHSWEEPIRPGV